MINVKNRTVCPFSNLHYFLLNFSQMFDLFLPLHRACNLTFCLLTPLWNCFIQWCTNDWSVHIIWLTYNLQQNVLLNSMTFRAIPGTENSLTQKEMVSLYSWFLYDFAVLLFIFHFVLLICKCFIYTIYVKFCFAI